MNVFHVVERCARRNFAKLWNITREHIDIGHCKIEFCFLRCCKQVQDRVCGSPHGDIKRHGVFKCGAAGNVARQYGLVVLEIVASRKRYNSASGLKKKCFSIGVGGE